MKRKLLWLAAVSLLCASCQKIEEDAVNENTEQGKDTRAVQFVVKNISAEYGTRATLESEGISDLWVWEGANLLCHQVNTDSDFGAPTVSLAVGAHDLTFLASKSSSQSWENGVWSCSKVDETFGTVLSYTVSGSSSSKQVQLTRVNGKVQWTIEDAIPTEVTTVSVSIPQCYGLDASLNGVSAGTFSVSGHAINTHEVGYSVGTMVLPADHANGSAISPTITFSNGVTYTTECSVMANVITNIHGDFFSGDSGVAMELVTDWGTQNDVSIK